MKTLTQQLARIFRAESGRVLAALLVHTSDIDLVEDALQDAILQAIQQWPSRGQPENLGAWLHTVARRRLIDRLRRDGHHQSETTLQAILDTQETIDEDPHGHHEIPDERLRLIFTCCHPALAREARVALTLKTLCGLTAREIARAFLTSETTMNQRLTRAKRKIRLAGIGYEVPEGPDLRPRLDSVLEVIYLIYNESYSAFEGQTLTRADLAAEAIHLGRMMQQWLPEPEVSGLLALMLLHDARRSSRSSAQQAFIPLARQDRQLWDQALIGQGKELLLEALDQGSPGPYQIQAAISALHAGAENWESTDWAQIFELYQLLWRMQPSPVVALNRCIALAYSGALEPAYEQLLELEPELAQYQPYHAARADLAAKLHRHAEAREHYARAIKLTRNDAERSFLKTQLIAQGCST